MGEQRGTEEAQDSFVQGHLHLHSYLCSGSSSNRMCGVESNSQDSLALGMLSQECEFKVNLGCREGPILSKPIRLLDSC